MKNRNKTPLLRPLRKEGGTLYIFPSATEDIGLNINSRANRVALSYYALLDIPNCEKFSDIISSQETESTESQVDKNRFMPGIIPGRFGSDDLSNISSKSDGIGSWEIAASLQNYAMNFETVLRNQSSYNYQLNKTVSERVFWKWLKETGAIRWEYIKNYSPGYMGTDILKGYYREVSDSSYYNRVVKCIGEIAAGNSLSTEFGMFNEIYITVPSSYGESPIYFQIDEDDNYQLGQGYTTQDLENNLLEGRTDYAENDVVDFQYTVNRPWADIYINDPSESEEGDAIITTENGKTWYEDLYNTSVTTNMYITDDGIVLPGNYTIDELPSLDTSLYVHPSSDSEVNLSEDSSFIFKRSRLDAVSLVKDLNVYQRIMETQIEEGGEFYSVNYPIEIIQDNLLDWDKLAIDFHKNKDSKFTFNTVLLYYTIYDPNTQAELATNLFGVLFLDGLADNPTNDTMYSGGNMEFTFNEIEKRQSNENGFGTGYSFRVNIKTSSIFDNTDALISDNTTANSVLPDNFNDVIYSLHQSLSLMRGNVYVTQNLMDKYNEVNNRLNNHEIGLSKLSNDLNTYLMYRYKDIISDTVDSDIISVRSITPSSLKTVKANLGTEATASIDFSHYIQDPDNSENWILDEPVMSVRNEKVWIKNAEAASLDVQNVFQKVIVDTNIKNVEDANNYADAYTVIEALKIKKIYNIADGNEDPDDIEYIIDPSSSLFINKNRHMYEDLVHMDDLSPESAWINYQRLVPVIILALKYLKTVHNSVSAAEQNISNTYSNIAGKAVQTAQNAMSAELSQLKTNIGTEMAALEQYTNLVNASHGEIVSAATRQVVTDISNNSMHTIVEMAAQSATEATTNAIMSGTGEGTIKNMINNKVEEAIRGVVPSGPMATVMDAKDIQLTDVASEESISVQSAIASIVYTLNSINKYLSTGDTSTSYNTWMTNHKFQSGQIAEDVSVLMDTMDPSALIYHEASMAEPNSI